MRTQLQMLAPHAVVHVPVEALLDPVVKPSRLLDRIGLDEELHLHLFELASAEDEVTRRDLVTERLAGLRDSERQLDTLRVDDVGEVQEDALRSLGAQVDDARAVLDRAHEGLEHQVEAARLGELAAALGASAALDVVGAEALLAVFAVDQRVGEILQMARGFPGARMLQDGAVEADDIAARRHHRAPPRLLDVALELNAERAVIPGRTEAAVDIAGRKDDPAALAEIDQLLHRDR